MLSDGFMEFLYDNIYAKESVCKPLEVLLLDKLSLVSFKKILQMFIKNSPLKPNVKYVFDLTMFTIDKGNYIGECCIFGITYDSDIEILESKFTKHYEEYILPFMEEHEAKGDLNNCKMKIMLSPYA